jgi:uncharacterized protein (TIGR02246 family)
MRRASLTIILVASFLVLFPSLRGVAKQQESASGQSDAIPQTVAAFIEAFNRHDPTAVAMLFDEDADFSNVRGETVHGRKAIEQLYEGIFAGRLKDAHRTATVKSIRLLTPAIALVDADWELTGTKTDAGADLPLRKGILILVMSKRNGKWSITTFHEPEFASAPTK